MPTHLFLTDYNSLYVADLSKITIDDVRTKGGRAVSACYKGLECGLWFGNPGCRPPGASASRPKPTVSSETG